jgi:hypothetical protein
MTEVVKLNANRALIGRNHKLLPGESDNACVHDLLNDPETAIDLVLHLGLASEISAATD